MAKAHILKNKSLVSWSCICGISWRNHHLKGKTDDDLADEVVAEFGKHAISARAVGD